jgi:hypothetical protein
VSDARTPQPGAAKSINEHRRCLFPFLRSKPTVPADKVILIVVSTSFRKPPVPDVGALGLPPMVISAQEILYQRCDSLGSAQEFFKRSPRIVIERAFHHPCGPVSGRGSNRLSLLKTAEHGSIELARAAEERTVPSTPFFERAMRLDKRTVPQDPSRFLNAFGVPSATQPLPRLDQVGHQ